MNFWTSTGYYVGREVEVAVVGVNDRLPSLDTLKGSLLLIIFDASFETNDQLKKFISQVIESHPLAVVIFGVSSGTVFDMLITLQAHNEIGAHMMTGLSHEDSLETAVTSFLSGTYPDLEYFDLWSKYSILIYSITPTQDFQNRIGNLLRAITPYGNYIYE